MSWAAFNAGLNGVCTVLLTAGFIAIKNKNIPLHRWMMGGAFLCSVAFLLSYLMYHFQVGATRYTGTGWWRPVYFSILISHTILATLIVPMVLRTLYLALKERYDRHAAWARWTWPLWIYVSITGVVIYWMLYH